MQIAFWSNIHGQTATTSNSIAFVCSIALRYGLKTLITHNHFEKSALEAFLLDKRYLNTELTELKDSGIDALSRFIRFNPVDKEAILSYITTLLRGRLDLLMGTKNANKELYLSDFNTMIETILSCAKDYYDLLIVDAAAGNNDLSNKILLSSDLIIINLNQNLYALEDFFNNYYNKLTGKCFFLISLYEKSSKYNLKNIRKKYDIKEDIGVVPYCRSFADACNEGRAIDFFFKNIEARSKDIHHYFINEVNKSSDNILINLGIDIKNKILGD